MAGIPPMDLLKYYPATLKDSDWQKKKVKIGRMVKTGLGAELKKVESLVKKVDTSTLDPSSNLTKSIDELDNKDASDKAASQKSIEP